MIRLHRVLELVWQYLRDVSGENDYARYRARTLAQGIALMSPGEFYLAQLRRKYSRINPCC